MWSKFATFATRFGLNPPGAPCDQYFHVLTTVSQSGDTIKVGNDILFCDKLVSLLYIDDKDTSGIFITQFGRVVAIFGCVSPKNTYTYYAAVDKYTLSIEKHPILDLPQISCDGHIVCVRIQVSATSNTWPMNNTDVP